MDHTKILEVAVVGGGPAGMSAALVFGRAMISTVIINEEQARNMVTQGSHGFLTRDGVHPSELLQIAKDQLAQYTQVNYVKGRVSEVKQEEKIFIIKTSQGDIFKAKHIVFATGYQENIQQVNLPGIELVYGKTVYPCPFCDGWERRNQPLALFGEEAFVFEFAKTVSHWTNDLIVFTNGKKVLSEEQKQALKQNKVGLVEDSIEKLISTNGQLQGVQLTHGQTISRQGGFLLSTGEKQACEIPAQLGVETNDDGTYKSNEWGKSEIEGIYIIGDAKNGFGGIAASVAEGAKVASMMIHEIIHQKWVTV
ncbi:NAD(P)/FAD-dependent oxidoreductase [Microscilla marina]|uniref:Thioredoxin reductase n=1 Tax=Microscilla marina ATCC 23134 TaxID=313606 RepID=A1ZU47_MICM2|nr:NAD(P)/FAD-dependent oxidoreductase [Microscilla marina]EAY26018.1 thioredoxin reductase [Microscilla marina ATCC 23134]